MKTATTATSAYVSPKIKVVEIDIQSIICQSEPQSATNSTEMYEGDDNW